MLATTQLLSTRTDQQSKAAGTSLQGRACMPVGVGGSLAATALAAAASGAFLTGGGGGGRSGEGSGSSTLTLRQPAADQCHGPQDALSSRTG